jgi:MFS family permease
MVLAAAHLSARPSSDLDLNKKNCGAASLLGEQGAPHSTAYCAEGHGDRCHGWGRGHDLYRIRTTPVESHAYDETSPRYAGWRAVLACFLVAFFIFGFGLYGHGVYVAELQRLRGWSASLISGAITLTFLLSSIFATFTHELVARFGSKRLILLGIAALAASTIVLAFATEPWQLYAAFILMSLGWTGMGVVVIATIVSSWFVHRRGLAISIAFNGASCGGVVMAPLLLLLVAKIGFPIAMLTATAIMVVVLVPVAVVWIGPRPPISDLPEHPTTRYSSPSQTPDIQNNISRAKVVRRLAFWTISVPFALALMAQIGFIVHQIALLEPKIGRPGAGLAVALTTFMAVIGRLCLGMVVDRLNPRLVTATSLVSQAAALLAIIQTDEASVLFAACALFGFTIGNLITLPPLIIHREFDAAAFTIVMGLSTAASGIVGALGPGLIGLVRSWSDGYEAALALCIMLELVAAAIVLWSDQSRETNGTPIRLHRDSLARSG